jgi:carbon-monoxide dehydrogenase large subunit
MTLGHLEIPSTITPGGFKGVGESGVVAPPPAIANAVCDALRPLGVQIYETPITPARLWAAIRKAATQAEA